MLPVRVVLLLASLASVAVSQTAAQRWEQWQKGEQWQKAPQSTALTGVDAATIAELKALLQPLLDKADLTKGPGAAQMLAAVSALYGEPKAQGAYLIRAGDLQVMGGKYAPAEATYLEAKRVAESSGDESGRRAALASLASVMATMGRLDEAQAAHEQVLALRMAVGEPDPLCITLSNLAVVHLMRGDYLRTAERYQQAERYCREARNNSRLAALAYNQGVLRSTLGDFVLAEAYQRDAIRQFESFPKPNPVQIAQAKSGLGSSLAGQRRWEEARAVFFEVGRVATEYKAIPHMVTSLVGQAHIALRKGEANAAYEFYRKSIEVQAASPRPPYVMVARIGMAAAIAEGATAVTPANALAELAKAKEYAETNDMNEHFIQALIYEGRLHRREKQSELARQSWSAAIERIEELRSLYTGAPDRSQYYLAERNLPYTGLMELALERDDAVDALRWLEMARARTLWDLRSATPQSAPAVVDAAAAERLDAEARKLKTQLAKATGAQRQALGKQTAELRQAREKLQDQHYLAHPAARAADGGRFDITPDNLRQIPGTVISYAVGPELVSAFVVRAGHVHAVRLPVKREALESAARRFRQTIADRGLTVKEEGRQIYQWLVTPLLPHLKGVAALRIVPDPAMAEIPLQALVDARGRYWWESTELSYVPSLAMAAAGGESNPAAPLLAVGNPKRDYSKAARATSLAASTLAPIPETEAQVRRLADLYGAKSRVLTNSDATEAQFKQLAPQAGTLHLAVHGLFENSNPMYSRLLLSAPGNAEQEDGELEAWEVLQLKLRARVAVLAGCETGRGEQITSEGLVGLSWAFLAAGAQTVVVSQWRVDAAATSALMDGFHARLQKKALAPAALRGAALNVMKQDAYRHPFYWSGFASVGN
jgi:CHAT domain-containing protein/tetratricopeptide (TPR) repeat protein